MGVRILSTGAYLPEQCLTATTDVETISGEQIDNLFTGGERYHVASEHESCIFMGTQAAEQAIKNAGIDPDTIDAAIGFTCVPDYVGPRDIYGIIRDLGLNNAVAWSLDVACASFAAHLNLANMLAKSGSKRILIVESLNWIRGFGNAPISNAVGDGAGAVIVEADDCDDQGVIDVLQSSDPRLFDFLTMKDSNVNGRREYPQFSKSNRVIHKAITIVAENALALLEKHQLTPSDIKWSISHQPGMAAINKWHELAGIPIKKNLNTYSLYGNVSAANIPITLNHYTEVEPTINRGDLILMFTAGSGVHPVAALMRY